MGFGERPLPAWGNLRKLLTGGGLGANFADLVGCEPTQSKGKGCQADGSLNARQDIFKSGARSRSMLLK